MKLLIFAGILFLSGCAVQPGSPVAPTAKAAADCEVIQKRVATLSGQDSNQLIRSLVAFSQEMDVAAFDGLEKCLTAGLLIDCDSRACLIREKYFVNNIKN